MKGAGALPSHGPFLPAPYLAMQASGLAPFLKLLNVPDYVAAQHRTAHSSALFRILSRVLARYEVRLAFGDGPFEDANGVGVHFEAGALAASSLQKQVGDLKRDLHTSVLKLSRNAVTHKPRLIYGVGQGAIDAICYAHLGLLEQVLASRNVQSAELREIAQAGVVSPGCLCSNRDSLRTECSLVP